jgi:uncharacterized membrane protein
MKTFVKATLLGGLVVLLPVAIIVFIIKWLVGLVINTVEPLSNLLIAKAGIYDWAAYLIVVLIVILVLFLLGLVVKTQFGAFMHRFVEKRILKAAPGYSMIKETIAQILGNEKPPFSQVALVGINDNDSLVTAFVTETHHDGRYTVFVPNGPNPLSGNIYHLKAECVHLIDVPAEEAMRSIISCGAGSKKLIEEFTKKKAK